MSSSSSNLQLSSYASETRCGKALLSPQKWCHKRWEDLSSPLGGDCEGLKYLVLRITLFIPLILATFVAYLVAAIGITINACSKNQHTLPLEPKTPKNSLSDLFHASVDFNNFRQSLDITFAPFKGDYVQTYSPTDNQTLSLSYPKDAYVLTPAHEVWGIQDRRGNKQAILATTAWKKHGRHPASIYTSYWVAIGPPVPVSDFDLASMKQAVASQSRYLNAWWQENLQKISASEFIYVFPRKVKETFPNNTVNEKDHLKVEIDRISGNLFIGPEHLYFALPPEFVMEERIIAVKPVTGRYGKYFVTVQQASKKDVNEKIWIILSPPQPHELLLQD